MIPILKCLMKTVKKIRGDMHNVGISLSSEYGRKKMIDDKGWYIEPQGQLTIGYLGGDNYTTSNGISSTPGRNSQCFRAHRF